MVRPDQDRIVGNPDEHVETDETWIGGRTRGKGRGVHDKVLVSCAVEVRYRKPSAKPIERRNGRYAGRVRLAVAPDRSANSLCGFIEKSVMPRTLTHSINIDPLRKRYLTFFRARSIAPAR